MSRGSTCLLTLMLTTLLVTAWASLPPECSSERDGPLVSVESVGGCSTPRGSHIFAGDVNGDSAPDLATALEGTLRWYAGDGMGGFSSGNIVVSGSGTGTFVGGQFGSNAGADFVIVNGFDLELYENDGNGVSWTGPSTLYSGGMTALAVGNVDGDANDDVVMSYKSNVGVLMVFRFDGTGGWVSETVVSPLVYSTAVSVGDMDGDGRDDLLWASPTTPAGSPMPIVVAYSTGSSFDAPVTVATTLSASAVQAELVDADAFPDIVVTTGNTLVVYLNPGNRTSFAPGVTILASLTNVVSFAFGDVDDDGINDVLYGAYEIPGSISWHAGLGDLMYSSARSTGMTATSYPRGFLIADLDNVPGKEMVVVSFCDLQVVLTRDPPPSWSTHDLGSSDAPDRIAVADLNFDGVPDFAWISAYDDKINVGISDGSGTSLTNTVVSTSFDNPTDLDLGDVNGDGFVDVVAVSSNNHFLGWIQNNGAGQFIVETQIVVVCTGPRAVAISDLDGDGDGDVVVGCTTGTKKALVVLNDDTVGTTWSSTALSPELASNSDLRILIQDYDQDGDLDIMFSVASASTIRWWPNDGAGVFAGHNTVTTACSSVADFEYVDVVGDANVDIAALCGANVMVYAGTATPGVFASVATLASAPSGAKSIAVGDVDGDGLDDIAFAVFAADYVQVTYATAFGVYGSPTAVATFHSPYDTRDILVGDWDGDGDMDLVVSHFGTDDLDSLLQLSRSWYRKYVPRDPYWIPNYHGCRGAPHSVACLVAQLGTTSRCVEETIAVPPGVYTGCPISTHVDLTWSTTLSGAAAVAAAGEGAVIIDCSATAPLGILFAVSDGASVHLDSLTLTGLGMGTGSDTASPALRVTGTGSSLTLSSVALTSATAERLPGVTLADEGLGGAIFVEAGGNVVLHSSVLTGCSASVNGGAVFARDLGTGVTLINSTLSGGMSHLGGALYASSGASVSMINSRIVDSSAANSGGGVACESGCALSLVSSVLAGNTAGIGPGGGLFLSSDASVVADGASSFDANEALFSGGGGVYAPASARLSVTNTSFTGNRARFGGAVAVMPQSLLSAAAAAPSSLSHPVAPTEAALNASVAADVVFVDVSFSGNGASSYGGAMYVCDVGVSLGGSLSFSGQTAGSSQEHAAARDAWVCAVSGSAPPLGLLASVSRTSLPWLRAASSPAADALSSASIHGPLATFVWASAPADSVVAGTTIESAVYGVDVLGSRFADAALSFSVDVADGASSSLQGGVPGILSGFDGDGATRLSPMVAYAVSPLTADLSSDHLISVVTVSVLATTPPLVPVTRLSTNVTVLPCGTQLGYADVLSSVPGTGACAPCVSGTFSASTGFLPCELILPCLADSVNVAPANATVATCHCKTGFFFVENLDSGRVQCNECPRGAICPEGISPPLVRPGFYPSGDGNFVECKRPLACAGAQSESGRLCNPEYAEDSYMCNKCADGYYSDDNLECVKCPAESTSVFAGGLTALFMVCIVAVFALILSLLKVKNGVAPAGVGGGKASRGGGGAAVASQRARLIPPTVSMVIITFQIIAMLTQATRLGWTSTSKSLYRTFSVVNLDTDVISTECTIQSFHAEYLISLALPVLCLVVVEVLLLVVKAVAGSLRPASVLSQYSYLALLDIGAFTLVPLLYIPLASAVFALFDCVRLPDGSWVIDSRPDVPCGDAQWMAVLPYGMAGIMLVLATLGYFAGRLFRARRSLFAPVVFARYGALYRLFRARTYWFGIADLGKRLAIVLTTIFLSGFQLLQIALLILVLVGWMLAVHRMHPYFHPLFNTVDLALTACTFVVLLVGICSYSERNATGDKNESTVTFLDLATIASIVVTVGVAAVAIAVDILQTCRSRAGGYSSSVVRSQALARHVSSRLADLAPEDVERVYAAIALHRVDHGSDDVESDAESDGVGMPDDPTLGRPLSSCSSLGSSSSLDQSPVLTT